VRRKIKIDGGDAGAFALGMAGGVLVLLAYAASFLISPTPAVVIGAMP
jgi:UDP-N-acetylmuramyl pentapeptide phosphotransferase/UDP-N-acetylglucosamine-1-phosphate transferase